MVYLYRGVGFIANLAVKKCQLLGRLSLFQYLMNP